MLVEGGVMIVWWGGHSGEGVVTFRSVPWPRRRRRKRCRLTMVVRWEVVEAQCGADIEVRVERGRRGHCQTPPLLTTMTIRPLPFLPHHERIVFVQRSSRGGTVAVSTEEVKASAAFLMRRGGGYHCFCWWWWYWW